MESLGDLLTNPMYSYLETELSRRCNLFRLWESSPEKRNDFLRTFAGEIRAIVPSGASGVDGDLIDGLPALEIIASFGVGFDKIDTDKCREKGIRVTNTPGVLTDDVADLAIGLAICTMRRICDADRFARSGSWKINNNYPLASKDG
ncbi:Glyoxylate/hydroxypyruvate reductase A HPR2 [Platanthera guangdongensis]|uniref:Glyoxylate/hydroxypyruvate reductase A HPR2 n=1 Tax=Platanthera guangdongensis TaxID=2320717 RepID=A0ABR2LED8_9ASPA